MRTRALAWIAIAAQAAFLASWIVAGALEPGYSHGRSTVSALAAHGAEHPWIVMTGLVALGLGVLALAVGLSRVLPGRPAAWVSVGLFALAGAGFVVAAFARLPCDPALSDCPGSTHGQAAILAELALLLSPFALARALWPGPPARRALLAGIVLIAGGLVAQGFYDGGTPQGTIERVDLGLAQAWFVLVAVGLLRAERRAPQARRERRRRASIGGAAALAARPSSRRSRP